MCILTIDNKYNQCYNKSHKWSGTQEAIRGLPASRNYRVVSQKMDSNKIGTLTELEVLHYILRLGYSVSIPFGDKERYDQIWDINGVLVRVQVKTARINNKDKNQNSIIFNCQSSYTRRNKTINHRYKKNEVDYFATMWNNQLYLVPIEECSDKKVLRFDAVQPQQPNISWASNYEAERVIEKLKTL